MIKILIGGSPCTHWSIAQSKNREIVAEGIGWELFKNYLIAKEKFKPDFFLYENNMSAASAIKEQICIELGVPLQEINSALVSAQNRERFYAHNFGLIPPPKNRGILLKDILESGEDFGAPHEKTYALAATAFNCNGSGKSRTIDAHYARAEIDTWHKRVYHHNPNKQQHDYIAEPVRIGTIENNANNKSHDSQQYRAYSPEGKSVALCGNGGGTGTKTGLYACPVSDNIAIFNNPHGFNKGGVKYDKAPTLTANGKYQDNNFVIGQLTFETLDAEQSPDVAITPCEPVVMGVGYRNRRESDGKLYRRIETHGEEKANALTTVQSDSMVAAQFTAIPTGAAEQVVGRKANTSGEYDRNYELRQDQKANCITQSMRQSYVCANAIPAVNDEQHGFIINGDFKPADKIYEVRDGYITIKDKQYPIKLPDGYYIIRKLTVTECCRLQTMPDDYCRAVSATQAYKGLGNGWTAEVIIHLLSYALRDVPKDEEIVVLSMYDGIGTGRHCFDKLGYHNIRYYAYEIDKYAMQIALSNYPDIIQCGDAFQLRADNWQLGKVIAGEFATAAELCG